MVRIKPRVLAECVGCVAIHDKPKVRPVSTNLDAKLLLDDVGATSDQLMEGKLKSQKIRIAAFWWVVLEHVSYAAAPVYP